MIGESSYEEVGRSPGRWMFVTSRPNFSGAANSIAPLIVLSDHGDTGASIPITRACAEVHGDRQIHPRKQSCWFAARLWRTWLDEVEPNPSCNVIRLVPLN